MDSCLDSMPREMLFQFISPFSLDDKKMEDVTGGALNDGENEIPNLAQLVHIDLSVGNSCVGPRVNVLQFDRKNCCLERVKPAVSAFEGMIVFLEASVVCNHSNGGGEFI